MFKFVSEDFKELREMGIMPVVCERAVMNQVRILANAKIEAWLAAAPEVYGVLGAIGEDWFAELTNSCSAKAKLVQIEPLEGSEGAEE